MIIEVRCPFFYTRNAFCLRKMQNLRSILFKMKQMNSGATFYLLIQLNIGLKEAKCVLMLKVIALNSQIRFAKED